MYNTSYCCSFFLPLQQREGKITSNPLVPTFEFKRYELPTKQKYHQQQQRKEKPEQSPAAQQHSQQQQYCRLDMDVADDQDETAGAGYAWEKGFERTWEGVEEDEHGNIKSREDVQRRSRVRRRVGG